MTIKKHIQRNYQKISGMKRFFFLLCLVAILFSCTRNPLKINVSDVHVDLKIKHLDVDLLKLKQDQMQTAIPALKSSFGQFFDIFTYRMIRIGGAAQENFPELLYSFVSDTLIRKLETNVAEKVDTLLLRKELAVAFKHYKYYFPAKEVPVVYTCISGFNQSVVTAEKLIGISLDKYMGADSRFYKQLGLPVYKRRNMHPEKIVPDVMYAWAVTEWPKADNANSLLSQMIQEGKMLYFLDAMLPDLPDTLKIGFTKKQLDFCQKDEALMWTYLAEHKLLFTTDRMSIKRFIDDGPYTSAFTDESPARTGAWLGWQIVRSYMKLNKDVKLVDLMNNADCQLILNQSGYQP
jgi:gliding motility-associated lipoprotein GldB